MIRAGTDLTRCLVSSGDSLLTAMQRMTETCVSIVLVADADRRLLGVVVDGDIRRALIRSADVNQPLSEVMTRNPRTAPDTISDEDLMALAEEAPSPWLPLVASGGEVRGLVDLISFRQQHHRLPNAAVIMAGGRGERLLPLTEDTPKPMMSVGGRPILETLVRILHGHGIERFYLSVNYLADKIEDHFGDGSAFGVDIQYLREDRPLGTAGSVRPLSEIESEPILIINGDVLSRVNPRTILDYHRQEGAAATVAVREHRVEVPFGVVEIDGNRLVQVREKPTETYFINAGIYVVEPGRLNLIPSSGQFDMTDLLQRVGQEDGSYVACFPVPEYWVDIGRAEDLERARREFTENF